MKESNKHNQKVIAISDRLSDFMTLNSFNNEINLKTKNPIYKEKNKRGRIATARRGKKRILGCKY